VAHGCTRSGQKEEAHIRVRPDPRVPRDKKAARSACKAALGGTGEARHGRWPGWEPSVAQQNWPAEPEPCSPVCGTVSVSWRKRAHLSFGFMNSEMRGPTYRPGVGLLPSGSERRSAVEAIGRFINQSPGCPAAAARARYWRWCRRATSARQRGRFGLGTFWKEDATSGSHEAS
jgi:hypothetical protein